MSDDAQSGGKDEKSVGSDATEDGGDVKFF